MEKLGPDSSLTLTVGKRIGLTFAELMNDVLRSVRAAVPIALYDVLGASMEPEQVERLSQLIVREATVRYRVAAAATLLTLPDD